MDVEEERVEEYRSLREEIVRRQDTRLVILGFAVASMGALIGLTLKTNADAVKGLDYYAFGLVSFALVLLIAALLLTIQITQQIEVIAAYIRRFIEPRTHGIRWETRWARYRELRRSGAKSGGVPLGTSKPLALYYALLTIAVYCVSFTVRLHEHVPALILVSLLAIGALACSFDLYERKTRGWKIDWSIVDE
jgi:hypothetical protein